MGNFASKPSSDEVKYHAPSPEAPTPKDVFTVRRYLLVKVPAELANIILNEARYWPKVSCGFTSMGSYRVVSATGVKPDASACCLLSPVLGEWMIGNGALQSFKVKAVRFTILSHDQGWASEDDFLGKYEGSWTWFETTIVRNFRGDFPGQQRVDLDDRIQQALETRADNADSRVTTVRNPHSDSGADTWHVQSNIRAQKRPVQHIISWTEDVEADVDGDALYAETGTKSGRGFVKSLEMGDRVAVIARAKYPGWENHIQDVHLEVYYSV